MRSGWSKQAYMRCASYGLELRVEVDRAVDRVDEAVQALAGAHVAAVGVDDEHVVGGQPGQREALAVEARRVDRLGR